MTRHEQIAALVGLLPLALLLLAGCQSAPHLRAPGYPFSSWSATIGDTGTCAGITMTPQQALDLIENQSDAETSIVVLDTRTEAEYARGHISGAENIASSDPAFWSRILDMPRDATYVICCRSGNSSRAVVAQMRRQGFENVCDVSGGFLRWEREGLPVQRQRD